MLAYKIAKAMGYELRDQRLIEQLAVCHDIGKSQIPPAILAKKDPLTDQEWALIRTHSSLSYDLLLAKGYSTSHAQIVRWHHEAVDGSGYPDGLSGRQIPPESQIISVADYFDAVTSPRPYRSSCMTEQQAMLQINSLRGIKFTSAVIDALDTVMQESIALQRTRANGRSASNLRTSRLYQAAYVLKGGD